MFSEFPKNASQNKKAKVKRIIIFVGVIYFFVFLFIFRDIIYALPELMRGEVVINGDELVPFFNPDSQFIDQLKGNFNQLTNGFEFRVRYSILTTWMRYYKILPFAILLTLPTITFISYLSVGKFLMAILPEVPQPIIYKSSSAPILFVFLILTYSKITHFYTLILGFGVFLIAILLVSYGIFFAKNKPFRYIIGACLISLFNPAVHYIILFAMCVSLIALGIVLLSLKHYFSGGDYLKKIKPSALFNEVWDMRSTFFHTDLGRSVAAGLFLGILTLIPYGLFVKFFVLRGIENLSETVPVTYYFIKDASVPLLHILSFDLAGIMDKFLTGDYLVPHPRLTNTAYTALLFMPMIRLKVRRALFSNYSRRNFLILCYGILMFSFWATLGYSGPNYFPTFHRSIAFISNLAGNAQSPIGDLVVQLMGTIVQVLRFPHRFQLIMFMMACILMPIGMIWVEQDFRRYVSSLNVNKSLVSPLLYLLFFVPLLINWQYYETFTSGNFNGFLSPYPVTPLQEVKQFLLELPEGKTVMLPPTETAKRIIDINNIEHKFIDKFHIYYLDMPSYYYGLSGDPRNKHEFFLLLRAMYYEQDWWVNIARDNEIQYLLINKELVSNTVGGAEYLREIESTIVPQIDRLDKYFLKLFENESYIIYEFLDLPVAERIPLYIDTDWNTFIYLQTTNLDLTRYYDLRHSMIVQDLEDYKNLVVVTDNPQNTMIDLYLKNHSDYFFRPGSISFPFNPDIISSTYYIAPMFRMFQFFSDTVWNRLELITPGMYGTVTGNFIGLPRDTSFRIDISIPEEGKYRLLLHGVSTANRVEISSESLGINKTFRFLPGDSRTVFFAQDKVFTPERVPLDATGFSIDELENLIPEEIVAVNYQFDYFDLGIIEALPGNHTLFINKTDQNPMLIEGVLVISEESYKNLTFPENVTVLAPSDHLCCDNLQTINIDN